MPIADSPRIAPIVALATTHPRLPRLRRHRRRHRRLLGHRGCRRCFLRRRLLSHRIHRRLHRRRAPRRPHRRRRHRLRRRRLPRRPRSAAASTPAVTHRLSALIDSHRLSSTHRLSAQAAPPSVATRWFAIASTAAQVVPSPSPSTLAITRHPPRAAHHSSPILGITLHFRLASPRSSHHAPPAFTPHAHRFLWRT